MSEKHLPSARTVSVLIDDAATGDTKGLCQLLRSGAALSTKDRGDLATLIELKLQKRKRGRPLGSGEQGPFTEKRATAVRMFIWRRRKQLRASGRTRLSKAERVELIGEVADRTNRLIHEGVKAMTVLELEDALKAPWRKK